MIEVLPVHLYLDPILSTICEPVTDFTGLEELAASMLLTMEKSNGIGLAANQVGINKQIVVMNLENRTKKMVVVNPRILCYTKEKDSKTEGCLSCPGISVKVKRWLGVDVAFQNILGEKLQYRFTDYDSRIFQHEWDHLNGVNISQRITMGKLK